MWTIFSRKSTSASPAQSEGPYDAGATATAFPSSGRSRSIDSTIASIEHIGSTAVATLTVAQLTEGEGVAELTQLLDDMSDSGAKCYVLDIQNVQHMDSACMACLVRAVNRIASSGGRIALVNPDHGMRYLFRMTKLDRLFPLCHDMMAALSAVERPSSAM